MLIQSVGVVVLGGLLLRLALRYHRKQVSLRRLLFWGLLWSAAGAVLLYPAIADRIAARMGLQTATGIDFVVYVSVGVAYYMMFWLFERLDRIERDLTTIIRHIALNEKSRE